MKKTALLAVTSCMALTLAQLEAGELSIDQLMREAGASGHIHDAPAGQLSWEEGREAGFKSTKKAFLMSLLLPGAGELYAKATLRGSLFLGAEALIWAGYFGFREYGSWLESDYRLFSASHGGVDIRNKDDDFFTNLSFYDSRDEFNNIQMWNFRENAFQYPETEEWNWEWESTEARLTYRSMRNDSELAYRRSLYMVGFAIFNRVASAIDAVRAVKHYNNLRRFRVSEFDLNVEPRLGFKNVAVTVRASF